MSAYFVRFVGDDRGFRVERVPELPYTNKPRWVRATVGHTADVVWIDLTKAYVVEEAK